MSGPIVLTLTRDIAAPPERVFDAWLNPAMAARFLFATPDGTMLTCEIDARIGGRALIVEKRAQGTAEHHLQYEEIDRPRRLAFLFRACIAGVGGQEGEWTRVTLDFAAHVGGTRLILTHAMDPEWASYEHQTREGWAMILAGLAREAERTMADSDTITPQMLRFERMLDAPVETVWRWLIEPELRAKWFMGGPTEPRVGGKLGMTFDHAKLSDGDVPTPERFAKNVGKSWHETIERIEPPHLLAFSWDDGTAGHVTIELAEAGAGRTQLTLTHSGLCGPDDARNFGGGWGSHLDVLQRRLAGRPVENFWTIHRASEERASAALA